ncbi:hypothetical protein [[Mycobacterium] zoologicum]|uniref:hypothetical protein n=1 Tax=[Mycobacterium] zoologicum TaxID=2872311 RepID=UPI001CDB2BA5|nr:hypothetical protein [Mycolicibacter sp. MYC101]MEB3062480.1 hypothetical protein [Mycolicibacter sp. MYC101]
MAEFESKEIAELVGLSPDANDRTIRAALAEVLASRRDSGDAARRERALVAEDQRLVTAAIADGRILASRGHHWRHVLASDRDANRALLASLASALPPSSREVLASQAYSPNAELDHIHILGKLGIPVAGPRSTVHASAQSPAPAPTSPHVRAGAPTTQTTPTPQMPLDLIPSFVPNPIVIRRGKPISEWTQQEISDEYMRRLGPRTSVGLPPAPPEDIVYWPSPNDTFRWNETNQQFEANPNYGRLSDYTEVRPGDE